MFLQVPVFPNVKREMIQIQCTLAEKWFSSKAQTEAESIGRTSTLAQVYWIESFYEEQDLFMY